MFIVILAITVLNLWEGVNDLHWGLRGNEGGGGLWLPHQPLP